MRDRTLKYLLVLPAVLVVALTALWPLGYAAAISVRTWKLSRSPRPGAYVGADN